MKKFGILIIVLIGVVVSFVVYKRYHYSHEIKDDKGVVIKVNKEKAQLEKLKEKAKEAKNYCEENKLDTSYAVFIDFSMPSGKKRYFLWDFKADEILFSSLCAHGVGEGSTASKPVFSNVPNSYCSSLGKYKTGIRSYSNYGINVHYKLHGMEPTNNNAFERIVVLHSYGPVPEFEIYPVHLPMGYSQGCPVISDKSMTRMDELLKTLNKPMLLWIFT